MCSAFSFQSVPLRIDAVKEDAEIPERDREPIAQFLAGRTAGSDNESAEGKQGTSAKDLDDKGKDADKEKNLAQMPP